MTFNVGMYDRVIRVWLGIMAMLFAYYSPEYPFAWLGWFGVIPLLTGMFGWCGLYKLLGISTIKNGKSENL